eukprot:CAMPEP_0184343504 /NCGR_PEP_ID=MMETSP1089-20130417/12014_1 /TAXON_ID=38269 ORGANISM="Gloeochaete wittrockiana, Strain SAG46.84" /NCGR_SAMPLE_ID=MMETSP1089 /ASSEMBLY_ACC=CAM_ASM_000445 /LENGTH=237 /DNA_ID=CAMNT_0026672817 /DNA_START=411 /DNA_END=1124 /DNA_ORIENTATION=-
MELGDLSPGDLIFLTGTYHDPNRKKQPHNLVHVEIFLGGRTGQCTIASRLVAGTVQEYDTFKYESKSNGNVVYHYRSIDPWIQGICASSCTQHPWSQKKKFRPSGSRTEGVCHEMSPAEAETALYKVLRMCGIQVDTTKPVDRSSKRAHASHTQQHHSSVPVEKKTRGFKRLMKNDSSVLHHREEKSNNGMDDPNGSGSGGHEIAAEGVSGGPSWQEDKGMMNKQQEEEEQQAADLE